MISHPFGDLISQHLAKKHGLSQNKLAEGIGQEPAVITRMCKGKLLTGPKARSRVLAIAAWFLEQRALSTKEEVNALLTAAGMSQVGDPDIVIAPALRPLLLSTSSTQFISVQPVMPPSSDSPKFPNQPLDSFNEENTQQPDRLFDTHDTDKTTLVHGRDTDFVLLRGIENSSAVSDSPQTLNVSDQVRPFRHLRTIIPILLLLSLMLLYSLRSNINISQEVAPTTALMIPPSSPSPVTDAPFPIPTPTIASTISFPQCGVSPPILDTTLPDDRFLRHQGVSVFTPANTQGGVQSTFIRAAAIDSRGLWFGMFHADGNPGGVGFSIYDRPTAKRYWIQCDHPDGPHGKDINALVIDHNGNVWAGAERGGLFRFDGTKWTHYGIPDLPNDEIFGLYVDAQGILWVGTWEGIAKFDGTRWTTPYRASELSIFDNHVHAFAVDGDQNIWIGHVDAGISRFTNSTGQWTHIVTATSAIGGNLIRSMVVQPATDHEPESVWVATQDGGVSRFQQGAWTVYEIEDGLPSNTIQAIALDSLNRVWVATTGGVSYFDGERWIAYHKLDTRTLAIGQPCEGCPFDSDHIWTGTITDGLTHSRLPFPDPAFTVAEVCIELIPQRSRTCEPSPPVTKLLTTDVVTVTYPKPLSPGQQLVLSVTMIPQSPYQIVAGREFLSNTNADDQLLFGAHHRTTATANADPGQPYTFMDYSEPWTMPIPKNDTNEQTFTSSWRVWSRTRYAGPTIHIVVTVKQ